MAAKAQILVEAVDATRAAMDSVERNLTRVNSAAEQISRTFRGVFIATAAIQFGRQIVGAAVDAEQQAKRLEATLKATGYTAGFTYQQLDQVANAMQEVTSFDDESIRNAQAQLVKFGNISDEVFMRALKLSADYSALMGTDLPNGAQQLGRALAAPNVGLTFLERNVGKFSDSVHNSINAMVEQGDVMGAQKIILDELDKRIGGVAETLHSGLQKSIDDVKHHWDDLMEAIGRSDTGQNITKGTLGLVDQQLKDIKNIVENGSWMDKILSFLAYTSPFARNIGIKPYRQEAPAKPMPGDVTPGYAQGKAWEARQQAALEAYSAQANAETKKRLAAEEKQAEEDRKKALQEEAQLRDKDTKGWIEYADAVFQAADEENLALAAVNDALEQQADRLKDMAEPLRAINRERELATLLLQKQRISAEDYAAIQQKLDEDQRKAMGDVESKAKDATTAAQDFALVMKSAAGDAIRHWQGFENLLQSIITDFAQIEFKKYALDPIMKGADSLLGKVLGNIVGGAAGGGGGGAGAAEEAAALTGSLLGFASGGSFKVGGSGGTDSKLVSFMATPGENVTVTAPGQEGGATVHVTQQINFSANTPAAVRDAVYAMMPEIQSAAKSAVMDARSRGALRGL